jgi:hypothetical protein
MEPLQTTYWNGFSVRKTCNRAGTSIVQRALNNEWLAERGVPNLKQQWVEMHYGKQNPQFNPAAVNLTGTA